MKKKRKKIGEQKLPLKGKQKRIVQKNREENKEWKKRPEEIKMGRK